MIVEVSVVCATLIIMAVMLFVYSVKKIPPAIDHSPEVAELRKIIDAQAEEIKKMNIRLSKGLITKVFQ